MISLPMLNAHHARIGGRSSKRGFVLVVIVVLLSMCLALFGVWARRIVNAQNQLNSEHHRSQAIRLAEAGLHRGLARHAADTQFQNETWSIPAIELDQKHAARVNITVTPVASSNSVHIQSIAEFPADELRRAQVTRVLDVSTTN